MKQEIDCKELMKRVKVALEIESALGRKPEPAKILLQVIHSEEVGDDLSEERERRIAN